MSELMKKLEPPYFISSKVHLLLYSLLYIGLGINFYSIHKLSVKFVGSRCLDRQTPDSSQVASSKDHLRVTRDYRETSNSDISQAFNLLNSPNHEKVSSLSAHHHSKKSRHRKNVPLQGDQTEDKGSSVEFFPKPQPTEQGEGQVWLTSYSRVPLSVLQEYCLSAKSYCPPGNPGPPGSPGRIGLKGEKGEKGFKGVSGPPGVSGLRGEPGPPGLEGRDGLPGEPGLDGIPGRDGQDGVDGKDGLPGAPGLLGLPGFNGTNGLPGKVGDRGPQGPPGPRGPPGKKGEVGKPGIPGPISIVKERIEPTVKVLSKSESPQAPPNCSACKDLCLGNKTNLIEDVVGYDFTEWVGLNSKSQECMADGRSVKILRIGKPLLILERNETWGCLMQDPVTATGVDNETYWLTIDVEEKQGFLYEYPNLQAVKIGRSSYVHKLPYNFTGNSHVVYNGSFYYYSGQMRKLVKYDLQSKSCAYLKHSFEGISHTYLYEHRHNQIDLFADENGVWAIHAASNRSNNTILLKFDPFFMVIERVWNLRVDYTLRGKMLIVCGVLYSIRSVKETRTFVDAVFDMFQNVAYDLRENFKPIDFINPFSNNSMIWYNPKKRKIIGWDGGNLIEYPIMLDS